MEYVVFTRDEIERRRGSGARFAFPDVREARESGLVGRHLEGARRCANWKPRSKLAAQYDRKIIVERGIEGREFECSVLGNEDPAASMPCEILPSREFYDYEDKYVLESGPHRTAAESADRARSPKCAAWRSSVTKRWAAKAWAASTSCCEESTGKLYINEINTIPGLHLHQHVSEDVGVQPASLIAELLDRLIELALERHRRKKATRFTR